MKKKVDDEIRFPSFSDVGDFLKDPIEIKIDKGVKPRTPAGFSKAYHAFLDSKIWEHSDYTVNDLISGVDIANAHHHSTTPTTALRNQVAEHLALKNSIMIEMVEDCGHHLDELDKEVAKHIAENTFTSSEYMKVKRSSDTLKEIIVIVTKNIEEDDEHSLEEKTKDNLKKLLEMNSRVDNHLDEMLATVNREELKADKSTWVTITLVVIFAFIYMTSFFALDTEKTATEQILYFFGIR